jgi:hypothetical protein
MQMIVNSLLQDIFENGRNAAWSAVGSRFWRRRRLPIGLVHHPQAMGVELQTVVQLKGIQLQQAG